ncbi:MAG: wax ester/triacylglycerol synthase domain-containing protein [Acidimicrobiales bacterium]
MEHDESSRDMTEPEAMMWSIERDPWLAPSGGSITIYDRPLDFERFKAAVANAIAVEPRLTQHVIDPVAPVATPHWEPDEEFDIDWHVRRIGAPGDGSLQDLLDWTVVFLEDPYDRTRPLWQFVVLDGVEGGRGALAIKLHHVVADGKGFVRVVAAYTDLERDHRYPEPEPEQDAAVETSTDQGGVSNTFGGAFRRPMAAGRAVLDILTSPTKMIEFGREVETALRATNDQLHPAGSPLWKKRSRRRHGEAISLPFDAAHTCWKALGGTLNDFFITGIVDGASRYHQAKGADLERLHITFVVSTRRPDTKESNAFTPIPLYLPAEPMAAAERFTTIRDLLHAKRDEVRGGGPMAALAVVANLLPSSVVSNVTRSQAAHIDIATSNLPGYLGDSYVAGAKTLHCYAFGPVAGTACNITLYTTAGSIDIGLHIDPVAIEDPGLLRQCVQEAFDELLAIDVTT